MTPAAKRDPSYRPYAAPSNVIDVLKRVRSRNLPERVGLDYIRDVGVPDGAAPRVLAALEFLGLVEDEAPTTALRSIARSTDEEYQATLADLLRTSYQDLFTVIDPAEDSQTSILNVFRKYSPSSQQSRMVLFFLALCREAGIQTMDTPRQRGSSASRSSQAKQTSKAKVGSRNVSHSTKQSVVQEQRAQDREVTSDLAPALQGLIRSLPLPGTPLSPQKKEQWLTMARATIDFIYPDPEDVAPQEEDDVEEEDD